MSWIHIEDMISAIQFLISNEKLSGVFNFTAPTPVSNDSFSKTLGKVLHRPSIFPVPSFVIKTMFGESADVILLGQNVLPKKLLSSNFKFKYPDLENALKNLLDS